MKKVGDHFEWPTLEVKREGSIDPNGYGLFTTEVIHKNSIIPYWGKKLLSKEQIERSTSNYILSTTDETFARDANPHYKPWVNANGAPIGCRGKSIAGYINACHRSCTNVALAEIVATKGPQAYDFLYVIAKRKILAGEELLTYYGKYFGTDGMGNNFAGCKENPKSSLKKK